ncbi:hypothetical protein Tcan_05510 [Toxocara canis]|uniref:N-acetyltransferase domain-containing protein n=1 Tax=Toxocara canis TaxID=6265 RepID=A0A0B2VS29_TOXCA|nr:hypothetical protein Tcan_05510 [Toxocara canis]
MCATAAAGYTIYVVFIERKFHVVKAIGEPTYKYENWFLAYEDYPMWLKAFGNDGFALYAALANGKKDVLGSVALAKYPAKNNMPKAIAIGMYFVHPDYRGMGIGSKLFNELIGECKRDGGNIALNGVQKMSPKYASTFGVNKINKWHPTPVTSEMEHVNISALEKDPKLKMITARDVKADQLLAYDMPIAGIYRPAYLRELLQQKNAFHRIAVEDGKIVGIINARKVIGNCLSIGPFYAEDERIASTLLRSLLESIRDIRSYTTLLLSIPTTNETAFSLIKKLSDGNFTRHDYMISQFTDKVISTKSSSIYAITEYAISFS